MLRPSIVCCVVAGLLGCGESAQRPSAGSWLGTVDTVRGVIHVRNPRTEIWTDADRWRIVEDLRIGRAEGSGPDVFGEIAAIAVSPSGAIYVLDGQAQEIRIFDSDGRFVRTVGRSGSGPGEFGRAYGLAWDRQGHLWVSDPSNGRYTILNVNDDTILHQPRLVPGVLFPWLGGFGEDGTLYDAVPRPGPDGSISFTYYRIGAEGEISDSLPPLVQDPRPQPIVMSLTAIMPRLTFRFDPAGYLWFGDTGEYRILQRTLSGDTVRVIDRDFALQPISAEERESVQEEIEQLPPPFRSEVPEIPATRSAFERIHLHPEGFLLIQLSAGPDEQGRIFDVFDSEGRYLGKIVSELQFTTYRALPVFLGDHVFGVTTDSLGVDYVVRAKIERPA